MVEIALDSLLRTLEYIRPALARRELLQESSSSFVFSRGLIYSFDGRVCIQAPFDTSLECSVAGEAFYKILAKLKGPSIQVTQQDLNLHIQDKKFSAVIPTMPPVTIPQGLLVDAKSSSNHPIQADFLAGLRLAGSSTKKDWSVPWRACVHVADDIIEACDNFRATRVFLPYSTGVECLLPADCLEPLFSHEFSSLYQSEDRKSLHFVTDSGESVSLLTIDCDYQDLSALFDVSGEEVLFPEEFGDALDRAWVFLETRFEGEGLASVTVEGGMLTCQTEGSRGKSKESLRMRKPITGNITFLAHPKMLRTLLAKLRTAVVSDRALAFQGEAVTHILSIQRSG